MKTLPTLTLITLILQFSLVCLAQENKDEKERQRDLHLRGNSKVIVTPSATAPGDSKVTVTPSKANTGESKVMVTPRPQVKNRNQLPANFNSMKDARRQQRRYRRQNIRDRHLVEVRPACSHQLSDPALHTNHRCSEQATWEAEYRAKYGRSYREPKVMRPYPEDSALERPFADK